MDLELQKLKDSERDKRLTALNRLKMKMEKLQTQQDSKRHRRLAALAEMKKKLELETQQAPRQHERVNALEGVKMAMLKAIDAVLEGRNPTAELQSDFARCPMALVAREATMLLGMVKQYADEGLDAT